ncbi:MAG: hypothetical protein ACI9R3_002362 [Verrucomicrobiales bacterium]|jgi:hypothetical protein
MNRSILDFLNPRVAPILFAVAGLQLTANAELIVSARTGNWSEPATWSPEQVPASGDKVHILPGAVVTYDIESEAVLYSIHVAGTLTFARDRNTALNVGNIRVSPDKTGGESPGVDDVKHGHKAPTDNDVALLEVGTTTQPLAHPFAARIRLHFIEGMNPDQSPAISVRPGGRMELHGAAMNRTWEKLGAHTNAGDDVVMLGAQVTGWRVGDEVIVTGGVRDGNEDAFVEKHRIAAIDGKQIRLEKALAREHWGEGEFRSEMANLSRNVIVESADPDGVRGHTMFHRHSAGSISYARFAHLGKEGVLGRYSIHFHLAGDTMRGSSIVGVAITDSHNRWVTVHGTHYIVVRDCVGYRSRGHGFFLEDATEVYNVFDRNLAVGATSAKRLPDQALPFDPNDGAGFWWANGKNTFVRNVSTENEEYGYRYDCQKTSRFDCVLPIRQPDGTHVKTDVRTIPIWRFEDNEAHTEGFYGMVVAANGGRQPDSPIQDEKFLKRIKDIDWTGPDVRHPHTIKNLSIWQAHYAFRPHSPNMLMENIRLDHAAYGIYRPAFENHVYRNLHISHMGAEPFNRGMDDASAQTGKVTVDGLTFGSGYGNRSTPLIQISDNNLSGDAETHLRNLKVNRPDEFKDRWPTINRGVGTRVPPMTKGVPIYIHDHFGSGRHAKVVSTAAADLMEDGNDYREAPPLTADESRVAEVANVEWPTLLEPTDDEPPATVITWPGDGDDVAPQASGKLVVRGTSTDNSGTTRVVINGVEAVDSDYGFHQWSVELSGLAPGELKLEAYSEDGAGNREKTAHKIQVNIRE